MESRAKFLGPALHPMLIVFPLGLLATGVIFDIVYLIFGNALGYALSFLGFGLADVNAWLGGELFDQLGVGVDDGAHLNSPNSLSKKSASQNAP